MTDFFDYITPGESAPSGTYGAGVDRPTEIRAARLEVIATADDNVNKTEPSSPGHAKYPYNKVEESLSGHVSEVDDTPGAERLMRMHKSGTFEEIHPDGTRVVKVFGEDFYIVLKDHALVIGGNLNITIQGNANMLVAGDVTEKIAGNKTSIIHGDLTQRVSGKTTLISHGDFVTHTDGNTIIDSTGTASYHSTGRTYIDGSRIDENLPGPKPSITDIGPGLEVPDSVTEPSLEHQFAAKSGNPAIIGTVQEPNKYPKDRKKLDESGSTNTSGNKGSTTDYQS